MTEKNERAGKEPRRGEKGDRFVDISAGRQVKTAYKRKGLAVRITSVSLAVLLLIMGTGLIVYNKMLGIPKYNKLVNGQSQGGEIIRDGSGKNVTTFSDDELLEHESIFNMMLFGEDHHVEGGYGHSDSMMLLTIDLLSKKIKITSFQRDTYVTVPGYGSHKITESYSLGGPALAIQTIQANFGIKIGYYASVDFDSFKTVVNELGGVDIELSDDEIEYINYQMYKNHQTSDRHKIKASAGVVHIDGQQALWYARNRGLSKGEDGNEIGLDGDDWDRTARQRKFMETIFTSLRGASLNKLVSIATKVGPKITTNLTKEQISGFILRSPNYLKFKMKKYNIPQDGYWSYYEERDGDGTLTASWIQINDMDKTRKHLLKFVFGDALTF